MTQKGHATVLGLLHLKPLPDVDSFHSRMVSLHKHTQKLNLSEKSSGIPANSISSAIGNTQLLLTLVIYSDFKPQVLLQMNIGAHSYVRKKGNIQ